MDGQFIVPIQFGTLNQKPAGQTEAAGKGRRLCVWANVQSDD